MTKLAATAITGLLLAAVPASAALTARAAPVKDGFLTIGGPEQLQPAANLRVPIRCSTECKTTAKTRLTLPDKVLVDTATGHLVPGKPRNLIVSLNGPATQELQTHFDSSRMRVGVTAVSSSTGRRVHAVKIFEFSSP